MGLVIHCQELNCVSFLCDVYFYFDFLFSTVIHFRSPVSISFTCCQLCSGVFKPCLSFACLPDCSSLQPSQYCTLMAVYDCLLRFWPGFAFWKFSLAQLFCLTAFSFDLPAFCLDCSVKLVSCNNAWVCFFSACPKQSCTLVLEKVLLLWVLFRQSYAMSH